MRYPRVFAENVIVFGALFLIGVFAIAIAFADHASGHLDFSQLPFLSEVAVDDDPAGCTPILFMCTLGNFDVEIVPDYPIRIVDVWKVVDKSGNGGDIYLVDTLTGEEICRSFSSGAGSIRSTLIFPAYATIDPNAGESFIVDVGEGESTLEGNLYIMAVRVL